MCNYCIWCQLHLIIMFNYVTGKRYCPFKNRKILYSTVHGYTVRTVQYMGTLYRQYSTVHGYTVHCTDSTVHGYTVRTVQYIGTLYVQYSTWVHCTYSTVHGYTVRTVHGYTSACEKKWAGSKEPLKNGPDRMPVKNRPDLMPVKNGPDLMPVNMDPEPVKKFTGSGACQK